MVFSPYRIASLKLRNRLVMAPMATFSSHASGEVHPEELAYLERRSAGGLGMVIAGACGVHASGRAFEGQWMCEKDERLPSLRSAAEAIHRGGAAAVLQIHHGGRHCPRSLTGLERPWSASEVPCGKDGAVVAHAMTETEILEIVESFGQAARLAKDSGWDGVEIHGANGYLLQQFVSPATNRREDGWAASSLRFPLEVYRSVRRSVGPGYLVGYRFSPTEQDGYGMETTRRLIDLLVEEGVDYLHVSLHDFRYILEPEGPEPLLTQVVRAVAGRRPLIGVGSVRSLRDAEEMLAMGADLVALGRALLVEPDWPRVVSEGREPRRRMPREGAASLLTLPTPLVQKMLTVPGWVELED
ncbi:MAG: hypothetical protein N2109_00800 [Fimbriimonadales bacterium]|nr:hypothetical protein [Fimbriimonadales bacterium]